MTTYYCIRRKSTGKYLDGYGVEKDVGRFYTSVTNIKRAFAAFRGGSSAVGAIRLQADLSDLEVVPIELQEGIAQPIPPCGEFPPLPKYIDPLVEEHAPYEYEGKAWVVMPEYCKTLKVWKYWLHRAPIFERATTSAKARVRPTPEESGEGRYWMGGEYRRSLKLPEFEILGPRITDLEKAAAKYGVEATSLEWSLSGYVRIGTPNSSCQIGLDATNSQRGSSGRTNRRTGSGDKTSSTHLCR